MRHLRYEVAMSLDGFIAGPKGDYDWIIDDPTIDFGACSSTLQFRHRVRDEDECAELRQKKRRTPGIRLSVLPTILLGQNR